MNLDAFWSLSYGMYVISTWDMGRPTGCIANCAVQVTAEPETIAVSLNHDSYTHECVTGNGKFAVSVLPEQTDQSLIGLFGYRSGKELDKFEKVPYEIKQYMPVLKEACAYMVCEVINRMETPTHTMFLGRVTDADKLSDQAPMTYEYYHRVIKGRSPKGAPTYLPVRPETKQKEKQEIQSEIKKEAAGQKARYVCKVCGYVYDGDVPFEELPEDYLCPLCKQPKSVFEVRMN